MRRPRGETGARGVTSRRYPWPVTPEELSTAIVGVLTTLSDEGALTLPDGVPTTVTVERPRQREHGDYATNVALQLAKKAGHQPARARERGRRSGWPRVEGIAEVEIAGPGSSTSPSRPARRGWSPPRSWPPARPTAAPRPLAGRDGSTSSSSRPTRPARCTSATPAGRRSATRSPGCCEAAGADGRRGSSTSTTAAPRWTSSAPRCEAAALGRPVPEDGYHGAYIAELADADRRRAARRSSTCPTPGAAGGVPRGRLRRRS